MTSTAEVGSQVVARARSMRDLVQAEAAESERLRTLTPAIVDEMWGSGLMTSFNPAQAGGDADFEQDANQELEPVLD